MGILFARELEACNKVRRLLLKDDLIAISTRFFKVPDIQKTYFYRQKVLVEKLCSLFGLRLDSFSQCWELEVVYIEVYGTLW